jgi:uncharacterized alpha-E superfamily protein
MKAQESLRHITGSASGTFSNLSEQRMGRLCSNLDYTSIQDIIDRGLHEFIDHFQTQLNLVGKAIRDDFFTSQRFKPTQQSAELSPAQSS